MNSAPTSSISGGPRRRDSRGEIPLFETGRSIRQFIDRTNDRTSETVGHQNRQPDQHHAEAGQNQPRPPDSPLVSSSLGATTRTTVIVPSACATGTYTGFSGRYGGTERGARQRGIEILVCRHGKARYLPVGKDQRCAEFHKGEVHRSP